ncbi:hypothetical protein V6U81_27055 [Micromonospora sp. CPCC 205711]|uniref:hypothetical protein n=1 Tax=Micromonospora sp. CPCC 205547 TaxID=3122400 RepID=UPI002FF1F633
MTRSVSTVDEIRRIRIERGSAPVLVRAAAPLAGGFVVAAGGPAVEPPAPASDAPATLGRSGLAPGSARPAVPR